MPAPRYSEVAQAGARDAARRTGRDERGASDAARTPNSREARGAGEAPSPPLTERDPRFVFPFAPAVNRKVVVQLKDGCELEGVLHAPSLDTEELHIVLSNARKVKNGHGENGTVPGKVIPSMVIPGTDLAQLKINEIPVDYQTNHAGTNGARRKIEAGLFNRDLVQWDGGVGADDGRILEDSNDQRDFDQFNGKPSSFKWDAYTSKIDPGKSKYSIAEATKIASEIEADGTKDFEDDTDSGGQQVSQDPKTHSSSRLQPTGVGQQSNSAKKVFSWADAVRGKSGSSGPPNVMSNQQPQKTAQLNKQSGAQWGQRLSAQYTGAMDNVQMKTMSLPTKTVRDRRAIQNSPGNSRMSVNSIVGSSAQVKRTEKDLPNGAGPEYVVEKKTTLPAKTRDLISQDEAFAKEKVMEVSRPNVVMKTCDSIGTNFDTQPSKRSTDGADCGSEDCFFDKPSINKRGKAPGRDRATPKKQEATPVHRTSIAVPLKGGVSQGNPWKSRVTPGSGRTDVHSAQVNAVDISNSPARGTEAIVSPRQAHSTPHSDCSLASGIDRTAADLPITGTSQAISQKQPMKHEPSPDHARKSDAVAFVDAFAEQTAISGGKQPSRQYVPRKEAANSAQKATVPPQVVSTRPVTSSRVQPGISWSQKVKESLARDSAKSQVPEQTVTSRKQSSASSRVPQNSATYKQDDAGGTEAVLPRKQESDVCAPPKPFSTSNAGLDRPQQRQTDVVSKGKQDAVKGHSPPNTSESNFAEGARRSATAGTSSEVGTTVSPNVHIKSNDGYSSETHKNKSSTMPGGSGANRRRIQEDTSEKQLNPNAPPFQPPLCSPYPYRMYDPMPMMFMNDMGVGMVGMPHHGVLYQSHRPPPARKGRGLDAPPANTGYFQPVVGPGFMPRPRTEPVASAPAGPVSSPGSETGSPKGQNGAQAQEAQQEQVKTPPPSGDSTPEPAVVEICPADDKHKGSSNGTESPNRGGSSIITPWPSFPGAGVWHSDQRSMHSAQTAMMTNYNSYVPGVFPVWPGMAHYVPGQGQQDPAMWIRSGMRPVHMPDSSHPGMPGVHGMVGMPYMPVMWNGSYYGPQYQVRHRMGRYGNNVQGRGRGRHSGRDSRKNHRTGADAGSSNRPAPARQED